MRANELNKNCGDSTHFLGRAMIEEVYPERKGMSKKEVLLVSFPKISFQLIDVVNLSSF